MRDKGEFVATLPVSAIRDKASIQLPFLAALEAHRCATYQLTLVSSSYTSEKGITV